MDRPRGQQIRDIGRRLLPPIVADALRRGRGRLESGFRGRFDDYASAARAAGTAGYQDQAIIDETIAGTRRIRDATRGAPTRAYDAWTVQNLAAIACAVPFGSRPSLRVLDFGGGMGVHYFTLRPFLPPSITVEWTVCETPPTARAGQQHFGGGELAFVDDIEAVKGPVDLVLTSGALQYTDEPARYFERLCKLGNVLVINRTPFLDSDRDVLTLQSVANDVYVRQHPTWLFNEARWMTRIADAGFSVRLRWSAPADTIVFEDRTIVYQGLLATT